MKNYYQKKGPYTLRENTYRRMRYLIADYDFFKAAQRGEIEFYQSKDVLILIFMSKQSIMQCKQSQVNT